ncbi:MAG TPA: DUF934 domain-containing protein [Usitatibacter sp.]|nr:DUF934 domain-containing protein [Usitatibacter sp.]
MPHDLVIRGRTVAPDPWRYVGVLSADELGEPLPEGPVAVPLAHWLENGAALAQRATPVGVWLKPDDEPLRLAGHLEGLALIAVHFPKFTDGRGYSTATLLRRRLGWRGELRAFGDVGRDQLFYLARAGFDAFRLADHRDPRKALSAFDDFSVRYQGSVDDPVPLFRKRLAEACPRTDHG